MAMFSISPGVTTQEQDQTLTIPAVPTNIGAMTGPFVWGPAMQPTLVGSVPQYLKTFGKPTNDFNIESWFSGYNFLSYSSSLYVCRAVDANAVNALANTGASTPIQVNNSDAYASLTSLPTSSLYMAKYPGAKGNSLKVSICDSANAYSSVSPLPSSSNNTSQFTFQPGANNGVLTVTNSNPSSNTANTSAQADATTITASLNVGDWIALGNTTVGTQYAQITTVGTPVTIANGVSTAVISLANTLFLTANATSQQVTRYWEFYNLVTTAPGTSDYVSKMGGAGDELHVVFIDELGGFTGIPDSVLEVYQGLSRAKDAQSESGGSNYYASVINTQSAYAWWTGDRAGAPSGNSATITASTNYVPLDLNFAGGVDSAGDGVISTGSLQNAWALYQNADTYTINAIIQGPTLNSTIPVFLISQLAEGRKDCIAFVSPPRSTVVGVTAGQAAGIVTYRNQLPSSSYYFMDSGYKYMYDPYNSQYIYVPLNADTAGLYAALPDPWWSPAGYNRGNIKNCIKLAYSPQQADRDLLYQNSINPVVTFPGQGTVLFGDKTGLTKPSAFSRINVRSLFIVIEKAIAISAKYQLFEFNDATTQAQFVNMVNPYLRDVQGRRGLTWFQVICDSTNNTQQVIDSNEFVGSIYVQPNYSINFINLTFTAVNGSVSFSEQQTSGPTVSQ